LQIQQPGSKIGKYPIVRLIAAGGMGMLYEALHPVLGFSVAIKTIRPDLAHDRTVIDRFLNEAISASRVRDERLPSIHDHATLPDGSPYMVMEFLEGEDLAHRLARGALAPDVATRMLVEVLEVLDKVHRLGIIHRDIKPQNIFLARSALAGEVPKLLDFGVAHIASNVMTRPGEVMGTPMYMALEQADGRGHVGAWTDVFAAGVVLYECLAGPGVRPWGSIAPVVYLNRLGQGALPTPIGNVVSGLAPGLSAAIMRALAIRVEDRWPDAASFAHALEPFARPRQSVFRQGAVQPPTPQTVAPDAATAWSTVAPQRPTPGVDADAVSRLRSRLAGIRRKLGADATERLRVGERRHVSLLALSFELSASVGLAFDPEGVDGVLHDIVTVLGQTIDDCSGRVEQQFGRTLLATFGHDQTREDDAEHAALAALRLMEQRLQIEAALAEVGYVVTLRIGLHSGFILHDPRAQARIVAPVAGDTATVVRFLESHAPLNGVYASRDVREAAGSRFEWRALGPHTMRNRSERVEIHELIGLQDVAAWSRREVRPFVGRKGKLAGLLGVCSGIGIRVGVVVAQPGFGKTRLIEEALRRLAAQATAPTILFAGPELEQPYGLWGRIVSQALGIRHGFAVEGALQRLGVDEARHAVVLRLLLGDPDAAPAQIAAPDILKKRIARAIIAVLTAAGQAAWADAHRPLLVVLDGLRRADEASLNLLTTIPGQLEAIDGVQSDRLPIFLVSARAGEAPIFEGCVAEEIALLPLSDAEVEQLARSLVPEQFFSPAALRFIRERAGGSPLFVEELVVSLADGVLNSADTAVLSGFRVPGSLYGMLLARHDRLPPRLHDVAQYVSVFGERIWPEVWSTIAQAPTLHGHANPTNRSPRAELNALADAGILEWRPDGGEICFVFRQELLREAIYATVLPENLRLLHRLIAEALAAQPESERRPPQILHHFHQARQIDRTVEYARIVGQRALEIGAFEEAGRALQLATRLQPQVANSTPTENVQTLLGLSWTRVYLGRLGEAFEAAHDAGDKASSHGLFDLAGQAYLACAQSALLRHEHEDALSELEMAEHSFAMAGDALSVARSRSAQGFVLCAMRRMSDSLPLVEDAWAVIRVHGQRSAVLRAAHDYGNVLVDLKRAPDALAVFDEALLLADARVEVAAPGPAEAWVEPAVRSARAIVFARLGRLDEAIAAQTEVYEEGVAQGNRITQTMSSFHLADHLLGAGRLDEAKTFADRAMHLAGTNNMPGRAIRARLTLAKIDRARGDTDGFLEHLEAGEFLARTTLNQEGGAADGIWLKLAKPLADALQSPDQAPRRGQVHGEARRRASNSVDGDLLAWIATLDAQGEAAHSDAESAAPDDARDEDDG
jgi:class 3 adenylate cyclase/tetratricopeptide (TPR) repeat protein